MRIRATDQVHTHWWVGYPAAIAIEAAVTGFLLLIQVWLPLGRFPVLYFLATGVIAYAFGAGPAIFAFIIGVIAFDYFFIPPVGTLWPIADSPLGWAGWAALLIGTSFSAVTMTLVRKSRQNTSEALARAEHELAERIQTEEDLARQRGLYQGIVDNIPIYLVIWDEQLQEFRFNEAFRFDTGWTEADAADGDFMSKVYPDPKYRRQVEEFMLSLQPGFRDLRTTAKDGRKVDISWANIRLASGYSVGIGVNITERKQSEQALEAERARLQAVLDSLPVAVWIANEKGTVIQTNKAVDRIWGKTPVPYDIEEYRAYKGWWADTGEPLEAEDWALARAVTKGEVSTGEIIDIERFDGTRGTILNNASPVRDSEGRIIGGVAVAQDITELKQTEDALRRSEARWSAALESIGEGVIIATEGEQVIYWNPAARELHGFKSPQEGIGPLRETPLTFELWTPDARHLLELDEWPMKRIKRGEEVRDLELRLRRPDQDWEKIVSYSGTMVETASGERLIFLSLHDLTEQRRAEQALRESEERLRLALEVADLGTWDLDLVNDAAVRSLRHDQIWGFREHQPEWGFEIAMQRVVPEDRPLIMEAYEHGLKSGMIHHENRIFWPDGSIHWISATGQVRYDSEGRPVRIIGVVADITEQKQAEQSLRESQERYRKLSEELEQRVIQRTEQLEATNKELEAFSYSVSHDLRAPLRIIDGFSLALLEDYGDRLDQEARSYLGFLRDSAQRMAQLIDDILRLSRIGRAEMNLEEVDLSATALSIITSLQHQSPERQVDVTVQPGLTVCADTDLIRLVIENLLGNAWKYTSKKPDARIKFGSTAQDDERVYYVRDNGAGFDMAYADRLFTPFQRLHTEAEFPGTGIGLSIVRRIIARHGGRVWAEGEVGKGATFYFTLPTEGDCG